LRDTKRWNDDAPIRERGHARTGPTSAHNQRPTMTATIIPTSCAPMNASTPRCITALPATGHAI
jgi:hypothetical protein